MLLLPNPRTASDLHKQSMAAMNAVSDGNHDSDSAAKNLFVDGIMHDPPLHSFDEVIMKFAKIRKGFAYFRKIFDKFDGTCGSHGRWQ